MSPRASRKKTSAKSLRDRLPRTRADLLKAVEQLRDIRPMAVSNKLLSCRMEQFSLLTVATKGNSSSVEVLGLRLSHPFNLKNRSIKIGPVAARHWKLTFLDLQLRKAGSRQ